MDRNSKDDTNVGESEPLEEVSFEEQSLDIKEGASLPELEKSMAEEPHKKSNLPIYLISIFITLSGATAIFQPLATRLSGHPKLFELLNIYDYYHWAKLVSVGFGLFLILLSYNLAKRKRMAWSLAFYSCLFSTLAHGGRYGLEYIVWLKDRELSHFLPNLASLAPALTAILLFFLRDRFTVRSERGDLKNGLFILLVSVPLLIAYGTIGFWLLEIRDFGINFELGEAFLRALSQLAFLGNEDIHARSRFATWFLNSITLLEGGTFLYAGMCLFQPINYRLNTAIKEREQASSILEKHGKDALDNYKLIEDKSYYFSASGEAFLAYKAVLNVAIALGDPVGPEEELSPLVKSFKKFCHDNDWTIAFLQVKPDYLELYKANGLKVLKVGEDAIVDLDLFMDKTARKKSFKSAIKKLDKENYRLVRHEGPLPESLLDDLQSISDEWLSLPGRKERGFSLGWFDRSQLKQDTVYVLTSREGEAIAFVNQVRSYAENQVSIDMMRHRKEVPNGTMDYLFAKLFEDLHSRGYKTFSLGLAALSGVGDKPGASKEEKAVHLIYEHMNRFFSYKGLRQYKSKFSPVWEERFLVYEKSPTALIKTALAIARAGEIDD